MMLKLRSVWFRFIKFAKRRTGVDVRQCELRRKYYAGDINQDNRDDASDMAATSTEHDVVVEYSRANEGRAARLLRGRYETLAHEDLPRDILDTLYDLNHRLNRRDGD